MLMTYMLGLILLIKDVSTLNHCHLNSYVALLLFNFLIFFFDVKVNRPLYVHWIGAKRPIIGILK